MENLKALLSSNPTWKILGRQKLKQLVKSKGIAGKTVDEYFDGLELHQIFSRTKRPDKELKINAPPYCYQIDIVLMSSYRSSNNGIDKFLLIVDILSRKAFAYVLKSGKATDVLSAYDDFVKDVGKDRLTSVAGDDFFGNAAFMKRNDELGVDVFHDVAAEDHMTKYGNKLGIIDRLVRTLKAYIKKVMIDSKSARWSRFLPDILDLYNGSPHSSLKGKSPNEAFEDVAFLSQLYLHQKGYNEYVSGTIALKVGDRVRAAVGKKMFEKEGAVFSKMIYTIESKDKNKFRLRDEEGKLVKRKYKPVELKPVIGEVTERIDDRELKSVEAHHKKVVKVRKATGKGYLDAETAIAEQNTPRPQRTAYGPAKLNL